MSYPLPNLLSMSLLIDSAQSLDSLGAPRNAAMPSITVNESVPALEYLKTSEPKATPLLFPENESSATATDSSSPSVSAAIAFIKNLPHANSLEAAATLQTATISKTSLDDNPAHLAEDSQDIVVHSNPSLRHTWTRLLDPNYFLELARTTEPSFGGLDIDPFFSILRHDTSASAERCEQLRPVVPGLLKYLFFQTQHPRFIQSAPYAEPQHLLDLTALDLPNKLFSMALTKLEPVDDFYATTDYHKAFKWDDLLFNLNLLSVSSGYQWPEHSFYVVVFRSQLKAGIDKERLFKLDSKSHEEAVESGGLLKYWFGVANSEHRNLATCKFPFVPLTLFQVVLLTCSAGQVSGVTARMLTPGVKAHGMPRPGSPPESSTSPLYSQPSD